MRDGAHQSKGRIVAQAAVLVLLVCGVGCAPQGERSVNGDGVRGGTEDGAVFSQPAATTSPEGVVADSSSLPAGRDLVVSVPDKKALLAINSLLVEEPIVSPGVTLQGVQPQELQGTIEEIAAQELSLKIFGREWISKNLVRGGKKIQPSSGVDAMLVTEILDYRERQGSRIGGEPGAVAFRMTVVRLSDKAELWGATYSLKEESVTDNLFRIGERIGANSSGLGWQSGREIFKRGATTALESFDSAREQQFLTR